MEIYIIEKRLRSDAYSEEHTWQVAPHSPLTGANAKKVSEAHCVIAENEYPIYEYRAVSYIPTPF